MIVNMVKRKYPNVSTSSIYEYAALWADVFASGSVYKGVNRRTVG